MVGESHKDEANENARRESRRHNDIYRDRERQYRRKHIEPDWHQSVTIHCPDHECDGMLLQSIYYHAMKCSKCGKLWMSKTEWIEVKELSIG